MTIAKARNSVKVIQLRNDIAEHVCQLMFSTRSRRAVLEYLGTLDLGISPEWTITYMSTEFECGVWLHCRKAGTEPYRRHSQANTEKA